MSTLVGFLRNYAWGIALLVVLIAITAFVFRPAARRRYEQEEKIPFEDD